MTVSRLPCFFNRNTEKMKFLIKKIFSQEKINKIYYSLLTNGKSVLAGGISLVLNITKGRRDLLDNRERQSLKNRHRKKLLADSTKIIFEWNKKILS